METHITSIQEMLIQEVYSRPPLWNHKLPLNDRTKSIKDELWLSIYEALDEQIPLTDLPKKWKNIHDAYSASKRNVRKYKSSSGLAAKEPKKYVHHDLLSFLDGISKPRKTTTNPESLTVDFHFEDDSSPEPSPGPSLEPFSPAASTSPQASTPCNNMNKVKLEDAIIVFREKPPTEEDPLNVAINRVIDKFPQPMRFQVQMDVLAYLRKRLNSVDFDN